MSLRAEIIRLGVRWFIKRRTRPQTVEEARARLAAIDRFIPGPPAGTETAVVDAGGVKAHRITTSASRRNRHILFLHGGGYVTGSPSLYRHLTWRIAAAARAQVLAIDYRLAPEHPFPAALDDTVTSYRWLLADGADSRRIAVMGDSAGGGLAFALLLRLRDEGGSLPSAAVALSPWTDLALTGPSVRENAVADPMLNPDGAEELAACYLGGADPRTPYASPLYGDRGKRRGRARRRAAHGGTAARCGVSRRARGMAAHAACVASVRAGDARGQPGDRAHRDFSRQQPVMPFAADP